MACSNSDVMVGGVEAGGTKFVCAIGSGPGDIRAEVRFPTTTPEETLRRVIEFFEREQQTTPLAAIGIGSFGPVDPNPRSPTYGYITSTPKPGWAMTDFAGPVQRALGLPVGFDTDVNAAGLGEYCWGAAQGLEVFLYLTIGTGIGGGLLVNGQPLHGLIHPELGHILLPHDTEADPYMGFCPFHGDCFEGLAAGPALGKRWGQPGETLPADHPAWALEANYVATALVNFACTLSPQKIIVGGGVMGSGELFPMVRQRFLEILNGYIVSATIQENVDTYIVPPALGNRSGVVGAIAMAQRLALGQENR